MSQIFVRSWPACLSLLLLSCPAWGQKSQPAPSQPTGPISGSPTPDIGSVPSNREMQGPLYVTGRVLMETGQPVPEPVSVNLSCGMRTVQSIHTDSKGYFQFVLGAGPQSNVDMSADDDTTLAGGFPGMNSPFGGTNMLGCELRVDVSGYEPLTKTISSPPDIQGIDAGTLLLRRRAGVEGSSISVTSLQVPASAKKEFDKGQKDEHNNHLASAQQHLLKATEIYDKYAAAWNELGRIYAANHDFDKSRQSFNKAITVDPKYIPPYVSLAALELQTGQFDDAAQAAGKALGLDPTIGFASFIRAAADLKLDKIDEAEKDAKDAENEPHQAIPQVHVLLAEIFVQKQDYRNAATQLRAYLKEAPHGAFVEQAKKNLDGIEKEATEANAQNPSAEQPQPAP